MKIIFASLLLCLATALHADNGTGTAPAPTAAPPVVMAKALSYMMIEPKMRAQDYQQAFDMLRREKTVNKIFFQLTDGSLIANIIEITLLENGTLLFFRTNSPQGIKLQIVGIESIVGLNYTP